MGRGSIGASHVPVCKNIFNINNEHFFCFDFRCFICLQYDLPEVPSLDLLCRFKCANLQARHKGTQPIRLYQPVRIFCCKQWVHAICCMNYIRIAHGGYRHRQRWTCPHCRHPLHGL